MWRRHTDRNAFLQQQLSCLYQWIRMETILHAIVVEHVGERDQTHALMVSHERANQNVGLILRQAFCCVINRLVVTVGAERSVFREPAQIGERSSRIDRRREHGRIRRHHQVLD